MWPAQIGHGGFHRARGAEHDFRRGVGLGRCAGDFAEHVRHGFRRPRGARHIGGDVRRGGVLLLDRGGDAGRVMLRFRACAG